MRREEAKNAKAAAKGEHPFRFQDDSAGAIGPERLRVRIFFASRRAGAERG
jgi:hypothetical protein